MQHMRKSKRACCGSVNFFEYLGLTRSGRLFLPWPLRHEDDDRCNDGTTRDEMPRLGKHCTVHIYSYVMMMTIMSFWLGLALHLHFALVRSR